VVPFQQIGADQGFLPAPVSQTRLLLGPAERADVIVDFSGVPRGTRLVLENIGPDEPFGGGVPCVDGVVACDFAPSDPGTTGVVMAFDVGRRLFPDFSRVPAALPAEGPPPPATVVRTISLNEEESATEQACFVGEDLVISPPFTANDPEACAAAGGELAPFGPTAALLGVLGTDGMSTPLTWASPITENPALGATETWEIYNFTADAHPIHLHLVRFKVQDRQPLAVDEEGMATQPATLDGEARPAEPWEAGYKDTVIAYPGEVTRVTATFDIPGLYVWHCHILEHEDNEMMRPYCVGGQDTCPVPIATAQ
jgi:bilirubin oxidase